MAHEIGKFNGADTIAYAGETPWHKLGQVIPAGVENDIEAVMKLAGLDWIVEKFPLFFANADGTLGAQNPYAYGVRRAGDDQILSAIGPETEVVQNGEAFGILEPLVKEYGCTIEVAGALGRGERVWMLLKAPQSLQPVPGDVVNSYMVLRHAHDNSQSTEGIFTTTRVVCANTMGMAIAAAGGEDVETGRAFRIKKTSGVKDRIAEAKQLMSRFGHAMKTTNETFATLARKQVTPEDIALIIEGIAPLPKKTTMDAETGVEFITEAESKVVTERRKTIASLIYTSPGAALSGADVETGKATAWSVLNAVSYYFDHVRAEEAKTDSAKAKALASTAFGANNAVKLLALSKLRKLAMVAAG
jgi:phage/plasmid-like protein (TIGR03299 family)